MAIDDPPCGWWEVLEDEKGDTCPVLARATQYSASLGVTIRRVMTDNGVGYVSHKFRDAAQALGQRHTRINHTHQRQMEKPSALSEHCKRNGHMESHIIFKTTKSMLKT